MTKLTGEIDQFVITAGGFDYFSIKIGNQQGHKRTEKKCHSFKWNGSI